MQELPVPAQPPESSALWWPRRSQIWYTGTFFTAGTNGVVTLDKLYALPFYIGDEQRFDAVGVAALGTASSTIRVGLYTCLTSGTKAGTPGKLIWDGGALVTSGSGPVFSLIPSGLRTMKGRVFVAVVTQGVAASTVRFSATTSSPLLGSTSFYAAAQALTLSQTGISGVLPAVWGPTATEESATNSIPMAWMRKE